ncbi:MAG: hypothetical protein CMJ32_06475 [Phycisphaerae bacterium]|nr:hypothetical protein [Phycisphaerae bacterium]
MVVAGLAYLKIKGNAERNIAQGDALMDEGLYLKAFSAYGRAVSREKTNVDYIRKMEEALASIIPNTRSEAQERYLTFLAIQDTKTRAQPTNPELWIEMIEHLVDRAQITIEPAAWAPVSNAAKLMSESVYPDDEMYPYADFYLGFSQLSNWQILSPSEREEAIGKIGAFIEKFPKNDRANAIILEVLILQAEQFAREGKPTKAAEVFEEYDALFSKLLAEDRIGTRTASTLLARYRSDYADVATSAPEIGEDESVEFVVGKAKGVDDQFATAVVAQRLYIDGTPEDYESASELLEEYSSRNPAQINILRLRSILEVYVDPDRAIELSHELIALPRLPVGLMSAYQDDFKAAAAQNIFDTEYRNYRLEEDSELKNQWLESARATKEQIELLTKGAPSNSMLLVAEAKLNIADAEYNAAASKLEEVISRGGRIPAATYAFAAIAALERGETGHGLMRIDQALELEPNPYYMLIKGRASLRAGRRAEAIAAAEQLLDFIPDSEDGQLLLNDAMSFGNRDQGTISQIMDQSEQYFVDEQYDEALPLLISGLEQYPEELRLIRAIVQLYTSMGNLDEAKRYLQMGLELAPEDVPLKQLRAAIETDDPIKRLNIVLQDVYGDRDDKIVFEYTNYMRMASAASERLESGEPMSSEDLEQTKRIIAAADARAAAVRDQALAQFSDKIVLIEAVFIDATRKKDWPMAERMIGLAKEHHSADGTDLLFQGRLAMVRGKPDEALVHLQEARNVNDYSSVIPRLQGACHEQMGNNESALVEYAEAYRRKPTDLVNLAAYSRLLTRTGSGDKALEILRVGKDVAGSNDEIIDGWLSLEKQYGSPKIVLAEFRRMFAVKPNDKTVGSGIARLLMEIPVSREDVLDRNNKTMFSVPAWNALRAGEQMEYLQQVVDARTRECNTIYADLIAANPCDRDLVRHQCETYRIMGNSDAAIAATKALIERCGGDDVDPLIYYDLGNEYALSKKGDEALAAWEKAIEIQEPGDFRASRAVSDFFFARNQWEEAYKYHLPVIQDSMERISALRHAEICIKTRRFEEAREIISRVAGNGSDDDFIVQMLLSSMYEGMGDQYWENGQVEETNEAYVQMQAALDSAIEIAPTDEKPNLQKVRILRNMYSRTMDRVHLDQALKYAERAYGLNAGLWDCTLAKVNVLMDLGRPDSAIAELDRYIDSNPTHGPSRRKLINMYVSTDQIGSAKQLLDEIIQLMPFDAGWYRALGQLHVQTDDFQDAARCFDKAYELEPSAEILNMRIDVRLIADDPDPNGVIGILKNHSSQLQTSPFLQCALSASVYLSGNKTLGLERMGMAYENIRRYISQGGNSTLYNPWYINLRRIYPIGQTVNAESYARKMADGKLDPAELYWLGNYWKDEPDGISRAMELYRECIADCPAEDVALLSSAWIGLGNLQFNSDDCEQAITSFRTACEIDPRNAVALNNLAYLYGDCLNDSSQGLRYSQQAVEFQPNNSAFLDTLGSLLLKSGQYKESRESLLRSIRLQSTASNNLHMAQLLAEEGRDEEARSYLQRAGELSPNAREQNQINSLIESLD